MSKLYTLLYDTTDAQIEEFLNGLNIIVKNDNLVNAQKFFSWWYESCMSGSYPEIEEYINQLTDIINTKVAG